MNGSKSRNDNKEENAAKTGQPLRRLRKNAGLTQRELAQKLTSMGFPTADTTVSNWESGYYRPPLVDVDFRIALATAFGISHDDLAQTFNLFVGDQTPMTPLRAKVIDAFDSKDWEQLIKLIIAASNESVNEG